MFIVSDTVNSQRGPSQCEFAWYRCPTTCSHQLNQKMQAKDVKVNAMRQQYCYMAVNDIILYLRGIPHQRRCDKLIWGMGTEK